MDYVLQTNNINKKYKNQNVLENVNINIAKGDIYGFVGENGSGKTTIIRIITGLIFPTKGTFKLFGVDSTSPDIVKIRNKIGAIVETPSIYKNMSAYENLKMQCEILGIKDYDSKIKTALTEVGLSDLVDNKKQASNFSLGMRQRLGIAMALLGDIEFLILDEPMNGLDPAGIVEIRELILKLNKEKNITFLISSHILTELSLVATKYGIISKGKIIKEVSSETLKNDCRKTMVIESNDNNKAYDILKTKIEENKITLCDNSIKIYEYENVNNILNLLLSNDININKINCMETNIEDYYLSTIGGKKND